MSSGKCQPFCLDLNVLTNFCQREVRESLHGGFVFSQRSPLSDYVVEVIWLEWCMYTSLHLVLLGSWHKPSAASGLTSSSLRISSHGLPPVTDHTEQGMPVTLFIPPAQQSCRGVYWFHSVRPSVRPSRIPCPLCSVYSSGWIHFIFTHLIKQLQRVTDTVCRV